MESKSRAEEAGKNGFMVHEGSDYYMIEQLPARE